MVHNKYFRRGGFAFPEPGRFFPPLRHTRQRRRYTGRFPQEYNRIVSLWCFLSAMDCYSIIFAYCCECVNSNYSFCRIKRKSLLSGKKKQKSLEPQTLSPSFKQLVHLAGYPERTEHPVPVMCLVLRLWNRFRQGTEILPRAGLLHWLQLLPMPVPVPVFVPVRLRCRLLLQEPSDRWDRRSYSQESKHPEPEVRTAR